MTDATKTLPKKATIPVVTAPSFLDPFDSRQFSSHAPTAARDVSTERRKEDRRRDL